MGIEIFFLFSLINEMISKKKIKSTHITPMTFLFFYNFILKKKK